MIGRTVLFQSSLHVPDAIRRLREGTAPAGLFSNWSGKAFIARVEDTGEFELWTRRLFTRNDFAPHLAGRIGPAAGGSRIEAKFGAGGRWSQLFMTLWLAFVGFFGVMAIFAGFLQWVRGGTDLQPWFLLVPVGMFVYGLILPRLGYLFGIGDEEKILAFLQEKLLARPDASMPIEPR